MTPSRCFDSLPSFKFESCPAKRFGHHADAIVSSRDGGPYEHWSEIELVMCPVDPVVTSTAPLPLRHVLGVAELTLFPVTQPNGFVSRTERLNLTWAKWVHPAVRPGSGTKNRWKTTETKAEECDHNDNIRMMLRRGRTFVLSRDFDLVYLWGSTSRLVYERGNVLHDSSLSTESLLMILPHISEYTAEQLWQSLTWLFAKFSTN